MKRFLLIICLLASFTFGQAQDKANSKKMVQDRIENMKNNLKLNATEGKTFWAAYEQFLNNEIKCHETFNANLSKKGIRLTPGKNNSEYISTFSDAQLTYLYDQKFELRKNLLNLETNFYKKCKGILTPKHIRKMYEIDEQYKREFIKAKKAEAAKPENLPVNAGKKRR